jgi:hypothetical protein
MHIVKSSTVSPIAEIKHSLRFTEFGFFFSTETNTEFMALFHSRYLNVSCTRFGNGFFDLYL